MVPTRIVAVDEFPVSQNGKIDRTRLLETFVSQPDSLQPQYVHDLHKIHSADHVRDWLARRGIDVVALVNEFVKPSAHVGVTVGGALAAGVGTATSPVELFVLVDDTSAFKRRKQDVAGNPVTYLPDSAAGDTRLAVCLDGVTFVLQFLVRARVGARDNAAAPDLRAEWTLHGRDVVERWRTELAFTV
jgi:hypothetical protein